MDDAHNVLHAAIAEAPDHPYWERAVEQEAAEVAAREREARERDEFESIDAEELRWRYRFQARRREIPEVHYEERGFG